MQNYILRSLAAVAAASLTLTACGGNSEPQNEAKASASSKPDDSPNRLWGTAENPAPNIGSDYPVAPEGFESTPFYNLARLNTYETLRVVGTTAETIVFWLGDTLYGASAADGQVIFTQDLGSDAADVGTGDARLLDGTLVLFKPFVEEKFGEDSEMMEIDFLDPSTGKQIRESLTTPGVGFSSSNWLDDYGSAATILSPSLKDPYLVRSDGTITEPPSAPENLSGNFEWYMYGPNGFTQQGAFPDSWPIAVPNPHPFDPPLLVNARLDRAVSRWTLVGEGAHAVVQVIDTATGEAMGEPCQVTGGGPFLVSPSRTWATEEGVLIDLDSGKVYCDNALEKYEFANLLAVSDSGEAWGENEDDGFYIRAGSKTLMESGKVSESADSYFLFKDFAIIDGAAFARTDK